jgi:hypothetical protein
MDKSEIRVGHFIAKAYYGRPREVVKVTAKRFYVGSIGSFIEKDRVGFWAETEDECRAKMTAVSRMVRQRQNVERIIEQELRDEFAAIVEARRAELVARETLRLQADAEKIAEEEGVDPELTLCRAKPSDYKLTVTL